MNTTKATATEPVLKNLDRLIPDLEALYKDIHAHPELSMQETRTAGLAADRLRAAGYEVTSGVGKTGVVGLLRNGDGPIVMLRADMDALPIEEATGLPYASKATAKDREGKAVSVGHLCGHDMHVAWLVGATTLLAQARQAWRGTLTGLGHPLDDRSLQGARKSSPPTPSPWSRSGSACAIFLNSKSISDASLLMADIEEVGKLPRL
jgi:metal-dependent amidase/aminoacylase/carboxypeptidase family protein